MFKRSKFLLFFACLQLFVLSMILKTAHAFDFSSLFEGIDFDQLVKDMEPMFEEMEKQGRSQEESDGDHTVESTPTQKTSEVQQSEESTLSTDNKTLFLEPIKIESSGDNQKGKYKFPAVKLDAYDFYMGSLIDILKIIEKKIDASRTFSSEFKTQFTKYKVTIDEIVVSDAIISDKKMYQRVFFLPNFNELRKKIIATLEKLKAIDKCMMVEVADEEKFSDELTKRAQEPIEDSALLLTPLELPKRTQRGKKDDHEDIDVSTRRSDEKEIIKNRKTQPIDQKQNRLEADLKTLFEKDVRYIAETLASARKSKEAESEIQKKKKMRDQKIQAARQRMSARSSFGGGGYGSSSGYQRRPYRSGSSSPWGGSGSGRSWGGSSPSRWGGGDNDYSPTKDTRDNKLDDTAHDANEKSDKDEKIKNTKLDKSEAKAQKKVRSHLDEMIALMQKTNPTEIALNLEAIADHMDGMHKSMFDLKDKAKNEIKNKVKNAYGAYYPRLIDALPSIVNTTHDSLLKDYQSSLSKIYPEMNRVLESQVVQAKAESMAKKYADDHIKTLPKKEDALKEKENLEKIQQQVMSLQTLLPGRSSKSLTALIKNIADLLGKEVPHIPGDKPASKKPATDDDNNEDDSEDDDGDQPRPLRRGSRLRRLKQGLTEREKRTKIRYFDNYLENITSTLEEKPGQAHRLRRIKKDVKNLKQRAAHALDNAEAAESVRTFNTFLEQAERFRTEAETITLNALQPPPPQPNEEENLDSTEEN